MNCLTPLVAPGLTLNGPLSCPSIGTPAAPVLSSIAGGSLAATTYYVRVTIASSSGGETLASAEASLAVAANRLLVVAAPTNPGTANALGWCPYVGTTSGGETKQTGTIAFGVAFTEATSGLIAGNAPPLINQTASTVSVGVFSCIGFTFSLISGVNSSIAFPGTQLTFYAGASPVALITSAGAVTAASYAAGSSTYGSTSAAVNGNVTATSYISGSSTYGATSASVNGPLTFAGGTLSGPASAFTIVPASTSGYTFRNSANSTSPMIVTDAGALTILSTATKPGGGVWTATSDERVKRNVRPHTDGLREIVALRSVEYEYNGRGGTIADGTRYVGLSAQAARKIVPRIVRSSRGKLDASDRVETDILAVDASELLFTAMNAIRELAAKVAALEAKVGKVSTLRSDGAAPKSAAKKRIVKE